MEDRRKYPRYSLSHEVRYSDASRSREIRSEGKSITEDVSRGGVRMKINKLVDTGKVLNLKIYNDLYDEPVDADAMVMWGKQLMGEGVMLGLSFTRVGWMESDKLFMPEILKG